QGNRYRVQDYNPSYANPNPYHYSNRDGSWYYQNRDNSTYYDDGRGYSRYTDPSG
ncbi:hypothetical protein ACRALDRAFT_2070328, partial [Sodiomyces alcalophilus JCM 7366]|uniref:uncharacterized protein n=1 Tax=Sodiomyces alcalophilus JCM 7366 TaxID=591952 RepID=UPI0039B55658